MLTGITISLSADDKRLKASSKTVTPLKSSVWRAEIVLLSADGVGTNEIMRQTGKSKTCVWRWQERFMQERFDGLSTRTRRGPARIKKLRPSGAERRNRRGSRG